MSKYVFNILWTNGMDSLYPAFLHHVKSQALLPFVAILRISKHDHIIQTIYISPGEGKGYPLQSSGLENSMDCIVHGVTKSRTRLRDFHFLVFLWYNRQYDDDDAVVVESLSQSCANLLCLSDSPGKNTGVRCHAFHQGIFLTQGSNPCLLCQLHWQLGTLPLVPPGKPILSSNYCHFAPKWTQLLIFCIKPLSEFLIIYFLADR